MLGRTGSLGAFGPGQDDSEDVSPRALADPDSQFVECGALTVHVKEAAPPVSSALGGPACVMRPWLLSVGTWAAGWSALHAVVCCSRIALVVQAGEGRSDVGIVLIHGYGSGVFAWRHIMWPLARATGCRVLAFDRPAFGEPCAARLFSLFAQVPFTFPALISMMQIIPPAVHAAAQTGAPCASQA